MTDLRRLVELRRGGGGDGDEGPGVGDEWCDEGDGSSGGCCGGPGALREGFLRAIEVDTPSSSVYTRNFGFKTMGVDIMIVDVFCTRVSFWEAG